MAAITTRGTMGQSGQGTLLPFFRKCVDQSPSSVPPHSIRRSLGRDTSVSQNDSNEDVAEVVAGSPLSGPHVEHMSTPTSQTLSPFDGVAELHPSAVHIHSDHGDENESEDAGRRKRRKTDDSSILNQDAGVRLDTGNDDKSSFASRVLANEPGPPSNAILNDRNHDLRPSTPPKRKILRLNANGKLLSSPIRENVEEQQAGHPEQVGLKRKLKGKPKVTHKDAPRSLIVVMKYGKNAKSGGPIGSLINDIIHSRKRSNVPDPPKRAESSSTGLPKPIHPFFITKAIENKAPNSEQPEDDPTQPTNKASVTVSPILGNRENSSTIGTAKAQPRKPAYQTDSLHPIWPPRHLVHIRGSVLDTEERSSQAYASQQRRKGKGSTLSIPSSESVLATLVTNNSSVSPVSKPYLRTPRRITCTGSELKMLTTKKLGPGGGDNSCTENPKVPAHLLHPAVLDLILCLPTARSSFDKAECDEAPWIQKYAPTRAEQVLQTGPEVLMLRQWLQNHRVSAVDSSSGKRPKPESNAKRKNKQKKPKDLDGFIVSSSDDEPQMGELSDDEDELAGDVTVSHKRRSMCRLLDSSQTGKSSSANAVLLSGPPGCCKTAAVYSVARELGFEVFEINAGSRRSARDIVERVGDMTQNHLVQLMNQFDEQPASTSAPMPPATRVAAAAGQNTMNSFFKKRPVFSPAGQKNRQTGQTQGDGEMKPTRSQKQSLILLEEVDILFEEDRHFWSGVLALISQSKRPIILTCNDENLLPLDNLTLHAIFRFRPPPVDLAVDYLLLVAASEGHVLDRQPISDMYVALHSDLRATMAQLNFWCQMAVGSQKSGLDWWTTNSSVPTETSGFPRTLSAGTFGPGMGWFNSDLFVDEHEPFEKRLQLMVDSLEQWNIGVTDWLETKDGRGSYPDILSPLDALIREDEIAGTWSALDVLCQESHDHIDKDNLDPSAPEISAKERSNYVQGYHILQAQHQPDYSGLLTIIGVTMSVLLEDCLEADSSFDDERTITNRILKASAPRPRLTTGLGEFRAAFEPLLEVTDYPWTTRERALSFARSAEVIAQDVAPYVRAIVAFDLRLEKRRFELSRLLTEDGRESKRIRTTRASRAALEGGSKATTRREKWFQRNLDSLRVLATGGNGWQDLCIAELENAPSAPTVMPSGGNEI